MPVLESSIDVHSEAFAHNRRDMLELVDGFRAIEQRVRDNSNSKEKRFAKEGKLLPRKRVELLLDRGRPFLELCSLAGHNMHDDDGEKNAMGGGGIMGIGFVSGVRCLIGASDSAIKGGAISPMGLQKALRGLEISRVNKLPKVQLIESAGANLLFQEELFVRGGRVFCEMARLSAAGIPQVAVVHGTSIAGGAYIPGLCDYVVAVRGQARIALAGAPLVKAALGEDSTDEELGGAQMHATIAGTAEYMAEDDAHGIRLAREVMANLGWNDSFDPPPRPLYEEPRYDPDELAGVVPVDVKKPYDVHEVIARIVDGSEFFDFKPLFGNDTVCGHARIQSYPCGIIGNNGPIYPDGAVKAGQFIQLCCQSGIPIIYMQNTTGYMVGREAEQDGMVKHGSKMIQAVANATVPQITLVIGNAYGAGYYGMCGRPYDPRFIFGWPNCRVAVMGGEQAARVMAIITEEKFKRMGQPFDPSSLEQMQKAMITKIDNDSTALFATARLWDDGIIDPRDSRRVLGFVLETACEAELRQVRPNTFGVARM